MPFLDSFLTRAACRDEPCFFAPTKKIHLTLGQMDTRDHNEYEKILRKMREPGDPKSWGILLISQQWRVWAPGCLGYVGDGKLPS